jgi:hypothetical protein
MAEVCPVTIEAQTSKVNSMTMVFFIYRIPFIGRYFQRAIHLCKKMQMGGFCPAQNTGQLSLEACRQIKDENEEKKNR